MSPNLPMHTEKSPAGQKSTGKRRRERGWVPNPGSGCATQNQPRHTKKKKKTTSTAVDASAEVVASTAAAMLPSSLQTASTASMPSYPQPQEPLKVKVIKGTAAIKAYLDINETVKADLQASVEASFDHNRKWFPLHALCCVCVAVRLSTLFFLL
jgi:hypothetical protein